MGAPEPAHIKALTQRACDLLSEKGKHRILITIAGMPGSGKSTIATMVAKELCSSNIKAIAIGMDGFHYSKAQLDQMPDPERAHKFRGAPFTFDADAAVALARDLASGCKRVQAPTFDHKLKDPVADGMVVDQDVRVVLFEGNYVQLNEEPWSQIGDIADDTWFISVDPNIARIRLAKRHLESGIVSSYEEGLARADFNDLPNGVYINEHSRTANCTIDTS